MKNTLLSEEDRVALGSKEENVCKTFTVLTYYMVKIESTSRQAVKWLILSSLKCGVKILVRFFFKVWIKA